MDISTLIVTSMKYRPSKRVVWMIIPLLPLLLMFILIWVTDKSESQAITTRGAAPPREQEFSAKHPASWATALSRPLDWFDEGASNLMNWDQNPWKIKTRGSFGSRFDGLFYTRFDPKKPEDLAEYLRLRALGKEWHERILARYPELAVTRKNLPDDQNGLRKWRDLEERLRGGKSEVKAINLGFTEDLRAHFQNRQDWNHEKAKVWIDANRSLLDEVRAIGLMPDQASFEVASGYYVTSAAFDLSNALLMEAHLAAEQGDILQALESIRAAHGFGNHFKNGEFPTGQEMRAGLGIQLRVQSYVFSQILPALPAGQVDIGAWENAVNPTLQQPADFSRMVRGEWNYQMQEKLLPSLSDATDPEIPADPEALAEAYTQYMKTLALQSESLTLADLSHTSELKSDVSDLSWRSRKIAKDLGMTPDSYSMMQNWEIWQSHAGLNQAAFAILKGQPIPNDPIYGEPYVWDPATRQLSIPDSPVFDKQRFRPITVPKL